MLIQPALDPRLRSSHMPALSPAPESQNLLPEPGSQVGHSVDLLQRMLVPALRQRLRPRSRSPWQSMHEEAAASRRDGEGWRGPLSFARAHFGTQVTGVTNITYKAQGCHSYFAS